MSTDYDPARERFTPEESPAAMLEAVEKLASDAGQTLETLRGQSFAQISELAARTYDDDTMPSFWRVWKDWHTPRPNPEMGDL